MYLYYIPKLTIQPLVENAVLHGVANLKETGMIGIFGSEDENNIYISIKDNGFGMPEEIIKAFDKLEDLKGIIKAILEFLIYKRSSKYYMDLIMDLQLDLLDP